MKQKHNTKKGVHAEPCKHADTGHLPSHLGSQQPSLGFTNYSTMECPLLWENGMQLGKTLLESPVSTTNRPWGCQEEREYPKLPFLIQDYGSGQSAAAIQASPVTTSSESTAWQHFPWIAWKGKQGTKHLETTNCLRESVNLISRPHRSHLYHQHVEPFTKKFCNSA